MKLLVVAWLAIPQFGGAEWVFDSVVRSVLRRYGADIDGGIATAAQYVARGAGAIGARVERHAPSAVMAVRGGGRVRIAGRCWGGRVGRARRCASRPPGASHKSLCAHRCRIPATQGATLLAQGAQRLHQGSAAEGGAAGSEPEDSGSDK